MCTRQGLQELPAPLPAAGARSFLGSVRGFASLTRG